MHSLIQFEDVKPDNILVKYGLGDVRFTDVQLADCGNTLPADSAYAKDGDLIGAPTWRSPEGQLRIGWAHKQTYSLLAPGYVYFLETVSVLRAILFDIPQDLLLGDIKHPGIHHE